ncbi:MAG TPA: transglycosylase SLT domain-containing protein [Trinickia sp.]|uniref:transglycosylase SLT domain-containing protein n=1 Tax=Trinickia sp. TaxID=2571163 RepID=UPI002C3BF7AD|nr:transglycosylase SLT domain-containing protein [Trinickia sp.]HVW53018.1 transglycosylase SLT domain-containing protein [Trinickia sp.]
MPVVPTLDPSNAVAPSIAPTPNDQSVVTAGLLNQGNQGVAQMGDALGQASTAVSQIAIDMQNRINQARVDDATNQLQAAGYALKYDPQSGFVNKTGAAAALPDVNGIFLADHVSSQITSKASDIASQLTPEQQRLFAERANAYTTNLTGEALQHEGAQAKQYMVQTNDATTKLAQDAAAQDYQDPNALGGHIFGAGNAAYKNAQVLGLQGPALDAYVKQAESTTAMTALRSAIANGDSVTANAIHQRYGSKLTASDAVEATSMLKPMNDMGIAQAAVGSANSILQATSSPAGQAFNANIQVESGGKQINADGTPVTSSKGAVGIAQVLPATAQETAQKHGIAWDPVKFANDPNYNRAIGLMYWQDQVQHFGGDLAKADAAYNAGPGAVDAAMQKANSAGAPSAWLAYLPSETQAYVPKVATVRAQSGSVPTASTLPSKDTFINAALSALPANATPAQKQMTMAAADSAYDRHVSSVAESQAQAKQAAMSSIIANGGDITKVPPATLGAMKPEDVTSLYDFAGKVRQGVNQTNPAFYADLMNNPQTYDRMSDAQWYSIARENLSNSDFNAQTAARANRIKGISDNSWSSVDTSTAHAVLSTAQTQAGLDPSGNDDMKARIGQQQLELDQAIRARQQSLGRKMNPQETTDFANKWIATPINIGGRAQNRLTVTTASALGMGESNVGASSGGFKSSTDIPTAVRSRIISDLQKAGVLNPTDAQINAAATKLYSSLPSQ